MKNEENYIDSKIRKRNAFQVPEGYFDTLTSRVMSQLPEKKAKRHPLRTWMYAAACVFAAVFSVTIYLHDGNQQTKIQTAENTEISVSDMEYTDAWMDYAMLDNQDIYACLTGE